MTLPGGFSDVTLLRNREYTQSEITIKKSKDYPEKDK
jgi:hypothetical protein